MRARALQRSQQLSELRLRHRQRLGRTRGEPLRGARELVAGEPHDREQRDDDDPGCERRRDLHTREQPHEGAEQKVQQHREHDRQKKFAREVDRVDEREHREHPHADR